MPAKNCYHFNKCMYQDQEPNFCSPTKCRHYENVKNFTDAQQLKAEIAALADTIEECFQVDGNELGLLQVKKLRQLSAV